MTPQKGLHFDADCGVGAASQLKIGFTLPGRLRIESFKENLANAGLIFGLFNTHTPGLCLFMRAGKENPANYFHRPRRALEFQL